MAIVHARALLLAGSAVVALNGTPAVLAQEQRSVSTLKERQELMRLVTQQQQSVLQQRFNCINRAANLSELERCERGYPMMSPRMGHGGWQCPMW